MITGNPKTHVFVDNVSIVLSFFCELLERPVEPGIRQQQFWGAEEQIDLVLHKSSAGMSQQLSQTSMLHKRLLKHILLQGVVDDSCETLSVDLSIPKVQTWVKNVGAAQTGGQFKTGSMATCTLNCVKRSVYRSYALAITKTSPCLLTQQWTRMAHQFILQGTAHSFLFSGRFGSSIFSIQVFQSLLWPYKLVLTEMSEPAIAEH